MIFALTSPIILMGVGGGIELGRAYNASQQLTQVADLACQYASRPSIVQYASTSSTGSTYVSKVTGFITASLKSQNFAYTQTNGTPFTYVKNGAANVSLASTVPTIFAGIVNINTIPIAATSHCYDSQSSVPQRVPNGSSNFVAQESFENTSVCPSLSCFINPNGTSGASATAVTAQPSSPSYTGKTGIGWFVLGYCVEVDHVGVITTTVPDGSFSAELDCDNGHNSAGNSSITTSVYIPAGSYELRYNYVSRVDYPNYDPTYICGSTASDVGWANDKNSSGYSLVNALRTNQINVYLDANTNGAIPTHTTIDGTEQLGGTNLIDTCVYARNWVERSVRINVTAAGYYWLSFAADGQNDSFGGEIDNIRLCNTTCPGSVQDNFPATWVSNTLLFEDTLESPKYTANVSNASTLGNLNLSTGTSGGSSGWPSQAASGWATAPYNQMDYLLAGAPQGSQNIELDASNPQPSNRSISRSFLLDPGYYEVDYYYISGALFTGVSAAYCTAAPNAAAVASYNVSGSTTANVRYPAATGTFNKDTNTVGVFVSNGQLVSTPIGGGALNSQTSFTNPDGTTSTTPTVPPYYVNMASYNANQANPLIDMCGFASSWQARTAYFQVTKPAYYWLTFAALGTADNVGGDVDDIKLKAVGSLYGSAPSGTAVVIPVPTPQPSSSYTNSGAFSGFSITADPLTVPAP